MFNSITKAFAASLVAAVSLTVSAPEAEAKHWDYCTTFNGVAMCANYNAYEDEVFITKNGESETFRIRCTSRNNQFKSYGVLTKAQAREFVKGYCEGRRGY